MKAGFDSNSVVLDGDALSAGFRNADIFDINLAICFARSWRALRLAAPLK